MMTSQYTQFYTAVQAAEIIMNDWCDVEDNFADIVILPSDKVDSVNDDEEIDPNGENFDSALLKDVTEPLEIYSNTALTDVKCTKPTDSEPTDKKQELC